MMLDMHRNVAIWAPVSDARSAYDGSARTSGRLQAGPRWHCISTNHGQQFLAESSLAADRWPVFFPLHLDRKPSRADRIEPMFAGYGFVQFDASNDDWPRICRTRGVYAILGETGRPRAIPVGVIEALIERTSPRRIVDDPGVMRGIVYLAAGARGKVVQGPFAGWEGLCTLSGQKRVRLLLEMFGTRREVEFKAELVEQA